ITDQHSLCSLIILHYQPLTHTSTLSLHDALPISAAPSSPSFPPLSSWGWPCGRSSPPKPGLRSNASSSTRRRSSRCSRRSCPARSEEHTSELQSRENLVCRLLLEKKKIY